MFATCFRYLPSKLMVAAFAMCERSKRSFFVRINHGFSAVPSPSNGIGAIFRITYLRTLPLLTNTVSVYC